MTIFEHCKQGSIDDAKRVYDQMIDEGFCRQEKVESALKFMEDITARECETNAETYGPLINVTLTSGASNISRGSTSSIHGCFSEGDIIESENSLNSILIQKGMNCSVTEVLRENICRNLVPE
ncbi:hypothetical protein AAHE18_12G145100 [Arachis hypogaea]